MFVCPHEMHIYIFATEVNLHLHPLWGQAGVQSQAQGHKHVDEWRTAMHIFGKCIKNDIPVVKLNAPLLALSAALCRSEAPRHSRRTHTKSERQRDNEIWFNLIWTTAPRPADDFSWTQNHIWCWAWVRGLSFYFYYLHYMVKSVLTSLLPIHKQDTTPLSVCCSVYPSITISLVFSSLVFFLIIDGLRIRNAIRLLIENPDMRVGLEHYTINLMNNTYMHTNNSTCSRLSQVECRLQWTSQLEKS